MIAFRRRQLGARIGGLIGTAATLALLAYLLPLAPPRTLRPPRLGALGAVGAFDIPLTPATGARILTPTTDGTGAVPTTRRGNAPSDGFDELQPTSGIRAFATASALFLDNIETGFDDIFTERAIFGQSAAGVATDGSPLSVLDGFGNRVLGELVPGATAFGHGAGMAALADATGLPAALRADATSPNGDRNDARFLAGTTYPPLTFRGINSSALANTDARGACVNTPNIAEGRGAIAELSALDTRGGGAPPLGSRTLDVDGVVDSQTVVRYARAEQPSGTPVVPATTGLVAQTIMRMPALHFRQDSANPITIRVLAPIRVEIGVGGVANSVWARWQPIGLTGNDDFIAISIGKRTYRFGTASLPGAIAAREGLRTSLDRPPVGIELGHFQFVTDHAAAASVRFDLLHLLLPGTEDAVTSLLGKTPLGKAFAALNDALKPLRDAETAPDGYPALRRISIGHFEARLAVRPGGLACAVPSAR